MKKLILFLSILTFPVLTFAQNIPIKGDIVDGGNGCLSDTYTFGVDGTYDQYIWDIDGTGAYYGSSNAYSSAVNVYWTSPGTRTISVSVANWDGKQYVPAGSGSITFTIKSPPEAPTISGAFKVCLGSTQIYEASSSGATSYEWKYNNSVLSSTDNSVTINIDNGGAICVKGINECGSSASACPSITAYGYPGPVSLTGKFSGVCEGSTQSYSASCFGATSFKWTYNGVPLSATGSSVTINVGSGGKLCATGINDCYSSTETCQTISVNSPPGAVSISGSTSACQNSSLTVNASSSGADSYAWTYNGVFAGNSSQLVFNIENGGRLCVTASKNGCSSSSSKQCEDITVIPGPSMPNTPSTPAGLTSCMPSGTPLTYTTSSAGASSFTWILPIGWAGSSTSNSITATPDGSGGQVCVIAVNTNTCGSISSPQICLNVTAKPKAPVIAFDDYPSCIANGKNALFSVRKVSGDPVSYTWTGPSAWTVPANGQSVDVIPHGIGGGQLCVIATDVCGTNSVQICTNTISTYFASNPGALATGTTNWNTDVVIDGIVTVPNGAILNISGSTTQFTPSGQIIVNPGGSLNISGGAKLTDLICNAGTRFGGWNGISLSTDGTTNPAPKIANLSIDGAEIDNAISAIQYTDNRPLIVNNATDSGLPPTLLFSINNCVFKNNEQSINLVAARTDLPIDRTYTSSIVFSNVTLSNLKFTVDGNMPEELFVDHDKKTFAHVSISGNYIVTISNGCQFNDNRSLPKAYPYTGLDITGLGGIDGIPTIDNNTITKAQFIVDGQTSANSFSGLGYAINLYNASLCVQNNNNFTNCNYGVNGTGVDLTEPVLITNNNTFTNIPHSIYLSAGGMATITGNTFSSIPAATSATGDNFGINLVSPTGLDIETNTFSGGTSSTPFLYTTYGIIIDGGGMAANTVFNNTVNGLDVGIQSQNDNSNLKIRCNYFTGAGNEAWVTFDQLRDQGKSCSTDPVNGNDFQAGNEFSGNNNDIVKEDSEFIYYSHDANSNYPNVIPWKNNIGTDLHTCWGVYKTISSCGSPIPGIPAKPPVTNCNTYIQTIQRQLTSLDNQRKTLQSVINSANAVIPNLPVATVLQLGNQADNLAKQEIELAQQITQVKLPCPSVNVQNVLGSIPIIEVQKMVAGLKLQSFDIAGLRGVLNNISSMNTGFTWNNIAERNQLQNDNTQYVKLMSLFANVVSDKRVIMYKDNTGTHTGLTPVEVASVQEIANAKVKTSAYAEALLTKVNGTQYLHPFKKITRNLARNISKDDKLEAEKLESLTISATPNPANDYCTIILSGNVPQFEKLALELFDITGRKIESYYFENGSHQVTIKIDGLHDGVYLYKITNGEVSIGMNKMIVVH